MQTDSNKKEVKANSFQTRPKLTYVKDLLIKYPLLEEVGHL